MGACSSRSSVLDDESQRMPAPGPQVEETTAEKDQAKAVEAEVFEDTLEHDPEEIPSDESKAAEGSEPESPEVVEKEESKAAEGSESEAPVVVEKEAIESEATPVAEQPKDVEAPLATEDSSKIKSNETATPASDNTEPIVDTATDKTPAEHVQANTSEESPAPKDQAKPDNSEAAGGNPFQSFMSNVTKGWGWR